jgi:tripartite-type tricarboxylate transporter receptor subunit TctC
MTTTPHRRPFARRIAALALVALGVSALAAPAHAAYPEQPIKLLVGFPPGGGGDLYGRLIAQALSKTIGQNVIVENRAGAGGNIAADLAAKAKPDGYTLLLAMSGNLAVAPATKPQAIPYKVPEDFAPIGLILEAPHGLFVAHNSRFKTAKELLAAAKTQKVSFASTGTGAAAHIGMEMVKQAAGVEMLHVPYKGSGPAITDMLGGQVDSFFATASPLVGQVRQGQLRLLAITGSKRSPAIPDVPTFKELGLDVPVTQWYGLVAPAGTPQPVVKLLSEHLSRALASPEVQAAIRKDAGTEHDLPMDAFQKFILEDIARYKRAMTPALLKEISQ